MRIALVGAGQMGRGFGNQVHRMPGLSVRLVIDIDTNRITELFKDLGVNDVVISNDAKEVAKALNEGKSAGTTTTEFLSDLEAIDFIVECTGVPDIGAQITYNALDAKKDIAVLNVEMDVTIGPLLHQKAVKNGAVYGVCHGDEPVEIGRAHV